ncbi:MAG: hypothetical protein IJQ85_05630 [Selenomonadaceae bacterium]|nr:hypothetical protein [Selenomonadaceae bacterium]
MSYKHLSDEELEQVAGGIFFNRGVESRALPYEVGKETADTESMYDLGRTLGIKTYE